MDGCRSSAAGGCWWLGRAFCLVWLLLIESRIEGEDLWFGLEGMNVLKLHYIDVRCLSVEDRKRNASFIVPTSD